jgi:hypothetical protein
MNIRKNNFNEDNNLLRFYCTNFFIFFLLHHGIKIYGKDSVFLI